MIEGNTTLTVNPQDLIKLTLQDENNNDIGSIEEADLAAGEVIMCD